MNNILLLKQFTRFCIAVFAFSLSAQVPSYYSTIDFNQSSNDLKQDLSQLITTTHVNEIPYTSTSVDTWDVLKIADLNPNNSQDVLLVYGYDDTDNDSQTDRTRSVNSNCTSSGCIGLWNREHVYARSLANPSLDTNYPSAGTDAHNLRASDGQMNSSRSNRVFSEANGIATITAQGHFYPGDEWKGDIARIIMYMYLRYPNQCLANNIASGTNNFHPDMPDVFLEWNVEDPVSSFEVQRNNTIASVQGNRNPFIDNPYIATLIWGGTAAADTWQALSQQEYQVKPIVIYPTVTSEFLTLEHTAERAFQYTIRDYSGRKIHEAKANHPKISVAHLASGYYILQIECESQHQNFKFIKR